MSLTLMFMYHSLIVAELCVDSFHCMTLIAISFFPDGGNVTFSLRNTTYQNNSLVNLEDIGEGLDAALLCVTDNTACCGRAQVPGGGVLGNWYYPNGTGVVNMGDVWEFYRLRDQSVVYMNRRRGGLDGIYRCVIPDTTGVDQTIYIGVYSASIGEWDMYSHILFQCNAEE